MRSKIEIELKANGTLLDITQGEDKIFQGAVGVTEYHLSIADGITGDYNWRPTDIVYMSLKRNDGQTAQVKMTAENGGWVWTSSGWETDVDISGTGNLELSFICKRYSIVSVGTVAFEKTTEKIDLIVYESAGYVPQNIDIEIAEELQEAINVLELDKVGRYSVSEENLPYLPAEIVFDLDGAKTPNNVYFDFTNNVVDYDGETREKIGAILVILNDGVQTELFLTSDGKMYSRTIDGEVTDFVSTAKVDFEFYTYNKVEIDQKDADTLQSAKDYADENFYNETDADNRFVHLSGNETIADTKTFLASPNVPDATANLHAVNRQKMYSYAYSKAEVNNMMTPMQVDTYEHFLEWIAGTYTDVQPAGTVPADFIIGKKVLIAEAETPNFKCISLPVLSIDNFEELAEDIKYLSEINAVPFDDITSENGQGQVEQINEKANQSARISEIETIDIEVGDWETSEFGVYYDYFSELLTDPTKQKFGWAFNLSEAEAQTLENENVYYKTDENLYVGGIYGTRIYLNKAPSISLNATMCIISYVNANITPSELTADKVGFDNIVSGLTATRVQGAIDELASKKVDKSAIKQTTGTSETDLMSQNAITSELNSKVNQSDFNALKSKLIYEDSSITFTKSMIDKPNLYYYVSGIKSNVLTLSSNSNYNISFDLFFSYTGIAGSETKTWGGSINTIVDCNVVMNLTGGFNKVIELHDSGPGGLVRKTLLQVNGEFSTGSSTKDFQTSMYIRIIDSMGNGPVSDLDTLNFVLTDITNIRIVEMPYENIGE